MGFITFLKRLKDFKNRIFAPLKIDYENSFLLYFVNAANSNPGPGWSVDP